jgi:hypothetical protein
VPYLKEGDWGVFPAHLLETAAAGFLGLKLTIFVRSIGSKTMKRAIWAILSASALLVASPLPGYAARGSVFSGAHGRVGQAAWGGHASSGAWAGRSHSGASVGRPPSGAWAGRPHSGTWAGRPASGAWGGHSSSGSWDGHHSGNWGHHHGGHSHFLFSSAVVLEPWWPWFPYYPYYSYYPYYPYYYPAPAAAVEEEPQVYSQPEEQESDYWYYCQDPQGYYPYVQSCPGGWMKVVPQPAAPEQ